MPAQKRSSSSGNLHDSDEEEPLQQHYRRKQFRRELQQQQERQAQRVREHQLQEHYDGSEGEEEEREDEEEDSDGSVTDPEEMPEFINVLLSDVRKDVQCPICLGIIKKTRTVMECMHRFCRECIDKSMRLGNNECPACRTHCASRRSLRDDPRYDALIESLYPDIEKYEEEELTFHEEERTRNKQIQASIAEISRRQSEALVKRRTIGKDTGAASTMRLPRNSRNYYSRRRRSSRSSEILGSDDNEDEIDHDGNKDSSSTDERGSELKQRRRKRRTGVRPSQPSPSAANSAIGSAENEAEASRENRGASPGPVWNREIPAWGRGGARSHTRHGSANGRGARSTRLSRLVDYLNNLQENDDELDVHLMLMPLGKKRTPSLQQPYLCSRPSLSVKHLCEYVAHETTLQAEEIEMLLVKETPCSKREKSIINNLTAMDDLSSSSQNVDRGKVELQSLGRQETLSAIEANCISNKDYMILAYRQQEAD